MDCLRFSQCPRMGLYRLWVFDGGVDTHDVDFFSHFHSSVISSMYENCRYYTPTTLTCIVDDRFTKTKL
jgi:hypothetical protein